MSICIFGDSITWGVCDHKKGGWVQLLKSFIECSNEEYIKIYNLGVSGDNTEDLLKRFKAECDAREPNKIVFAIGINDSQYILNKDNPRIPIGKFEENLKSLISEAKQFTDDIIFIGLTNVDESKTKPAPWNKEKFYDNESVLKYNSVIESVSKKHDLKFINLQGLLKVVDLCDGLHPNSNGHRKIFEVIKDKLF